MDAAGGLRGQFLYDVSFVVFCASAQGVSLECSLLNLKPQASNSGQVTTWPAAPLHRKCNLQKTHVAGQAVRQAPLTFYRFHFLNGRRSHARPAPPKETAISNFQGSTTSCPLSALLISHNSIFKRSWRSCLMRTEVLVVAS